MSRRTSPPPESTLARLWASQRFAAGALVTREGTPVEVLYPGRPGGRSGPDFRDAVLRLGNGAPLLGDVELHRDPRDFTRHGHGSDPAYDGVVLHVVFQTDDAAPTTLASGRTVPMLMLPSVAADGWSIPVREPCTAAVRRLGNDRTVTVLKDAGLWRLRGKAEHLAEAIRRDGEGQALYAALAVALGQTANVPAFELLAREVRLDTLVQDVAGMPESEATVALTRRLLHAAGLDGALLTPGPALPWVLHGLRPAAAPHRRIAALACIVVRLSRPEIVRGAAAAIDDALMGDPRALVRLLTVEAPRGPALCGRARAVELAVNALLPWAAARAAMHGQDDAAEAILALAGRLPPAEPYGSIKHLHRNLCDARGRSLLTSALVQQGALAMLGEWCRRGGCGRCPLST
jgi:hypothetical protein